MSAPAAVSSPFEDNRYTPLPLKRDVVIPLTKNDDWLTCLGCLHEWEPPAQAAVVIAPHPDDETLGAGALVHALRSRDVPVTVVATTDGENAYDTPAPARALLARVREQEQQSALTRLGVPESSIHRLRLPDSGLMPCVDRIVDGLMPLVSSETHLIAPWIGDFHPDHVACAQAAEIVRQTTGCILTSYFFWTWHRGTTDGVKGLDLRRFIPSQEDLLAKSEAIRCHASQLEHTGDEGPILPADLLGPVAWPFEIFLPGDMDGATG